MLYSHQVITWTDNFFSLFPKEHILTSGDVYPSYVRFVGLVHSVYSTYVYFVYLNMEFKFLASLWRENI